MKRILAITLMSVALMAPGRAHADAPLYGDDFDRADGPLGADWEVTPFGALPTISSNQACAPVAGETVALHVGEVDPAYSISANIDVIASDLSSLKFGLIFGNLDGADPYYVNGGLRNDAGGRVMRIETEAGTQCTSSTMTLSAGVTYNVSLTFLPDGTATTTLLDSSLAVVATTSCNVGPQTYNRIIALAGDRNQTGTSCFDNFEVFATAPVVSSCSDGMQNGNETGVDCGGTCDACAVVGCSLTPLTGCRPAPNSALSLATNSDPEKRKFAWSWSKGADTSFAEIGDPTTDADYQLCTFQGSALVLQALVPAAGTCGGKDCWAAKPEKSYGYKDKAGAHDGITAIKLSSGVAGKTKLSIKGKGGNLDGVTVPSVPQPIQVQLQNLDSGLCWDATFAVENLTESVEKGKVKGTLKP